MAAVEPPVESLAGEPVARAGGGRPAAPPRHESLYFALRNRKLVSALRWCSRSSCSRSSGRCSRTRTRSSSATRLGESPSRDHWLGTTAAGQDVFTQFVHGLRSSFVVGALAGAIAALIAMTIGFVSGYRGGVVDEILGL